MMRLTSGNFGIGVQDTKHGKDSYALYRCLLATSVFLCACSHTRWQRIQLTVRQIRFYYSKLLYLEVTLQRYPLVGI
jgi:hypothetical protein